MDSESSSACASGACSATDCSARAKSACSSSVRRGGIDRSVGLGEQRAHGGSLAATDTRSRTISLGILGNDSDRGASLFLDACFALLRAAPERANEAALLLHDALEGLVI